jgi:hypothetical protein
VVVTGPITQEVLYPHQVRLDGTAVEEEVLLITQLLVTPCLVEAVAVEKAVGTLTPTVELGITGHKAVPQMVL